MKRGLEMLPTNKEEKWLQTVERNNLEESFKNNSFYIMQWQSTQVFVPLQQDAVLE